MNNLNKLAIIKKFLSKIENRYQIFFFFSRNFDSPSRKDFDERFGEKKKMADEIPSPLTLFSFSLLFSLSYFESNENFVPTLEQNLPDFPEAPTGRQAAFKSRPGIFSDFLPSVKRLVTFILSPSIFIFHQKTLHEFAVEDIFFFSFFLSYSSSFFFISAHSKIFRSGLLFPSPQPHPLPPHRIKYPE